MHRVTRSGTVLRVALAMVALAGAIGGLPAGANPQADSGVAVERTFLPTVLPFGFHDRTPYAQHLALAAAPTTSVMYGVDDLSPGSISAYDLATLRPLGTHTFALGGTVSAFTVLPGRGGLLVAVSSAGRGQPTTEIEQIAWSGQRFRVISKLTTATSALGPAQIVVGFGLDRGHGQVFVLSASSVEGSYVPGTVQLSLVRLANPGRSARTLWRQPLPDCQLPMASGTPSPLRLPAPLGLLRSRHILDIGCGAAGSGGVYKPPVPVGVGLVHLNGSKQLRYAGFELSPFPGDATQDSEGLWFPREDRLVFQTPNPENGGGWVVFDGDHNAYVGSIPLIQNASEAGGDFMHGRLYLLANVLHDGLRTADVGTTPVDQGHTYQQYFVDHVNEDGNYGNGPVPQSLISTDPAHRRVFIRYTGSHMFVVLKDSVRYYADPAPPDPDQNTTDVPERPALTAANWTGSAQGYGSVIRQVGGASNLQNNLVPFVLNASQSGTQQLATSYLGSLQLTHGDARASAVTAEPDDGPTTGALAQAGLQWPYHPATCDDSGATKAADVDSARVACDSAGGAVRAAVVGGAAGAGSTPKAADLVVSSTALNAKSSAEFGHGITTTVTSVARGVSILGGQLQIGHIAATATVHAGGRPGTATSTYSRTLSNVVVAGQQLCARACDPKDLATQINEALGGRAVVSFPDPDRRLADGSPGGYQALVRRDAFSQIQETQLNDQDPGRAEVPAMQVTFFEDNTVKSRTVVYLAGVEAEAHYGIYRLSCSTCPKGVTPEDQSTDPSRNPRAAGDDPTMLPSTTQTGTAASPQVAPPASGVIGALRHGWQLLTNGISEVIRLFGVWLLLLAPVYLSARRWLSLSRRSRP